MPLRRTVIRGADLSDQLARLRTELHVPVLFPADVERAADTAAAAPLAGDYDDATDLDLVTLDPPGSTDLDQAFTLAALPGDGFRFFYAIADVAAFVRPGDPLDLEARARGETVYLPDDRAPLYPPVLSEGAASLLPGQVRPAVLWEFRLDADGDPADVTVRRATVRSRRQLDYPTFTETGGDLVPLLQRVGELRKDRERDRGGVSLPEPEQVLMHDGGQWSLSYRAPLPAEEWNAQLSLLTGMAAAKLMLDAGFGVLRTMPAPDPRTVGSLRRSALALGVDWPEAMSYADVVSRLDPAVPAQAALIRLAAVLFRGAAYAAFDGAPPAQPVQAAVAAPYAHATAPLRRLVDRYVSECCLAACAGRRPASDVLGTLPVLPELMARADQHAHAVDRAVVDLAEALLLAGRVGETFRGVVVEVDHAGGGGEVQLAEPAVRARLAGDHLALGAEVGVRLRSVDVNARTVAFTTA